MFKGKKILAIVPARAGSKGVKLKNIYPLKGLPLIAYTGQTVQQLDYIDRAVVSTDSEEIAAVAQKYGLLAPFMRPVELSGDVVGDWEVLHHALLEAEKIDNITYEIILMLQPTCPLRKARHVTQSIEKLIKGRYDAVWTVSKTDSKQHPLKQFRLSCGNLEYYDPKGVEIIARQQLQPVYHVNGAAYAFTRECLVEQKTKKGKRTGAVVLEEPLLSIDGLFDFELTQWYMEKTEQNEDEE